MFLLFSFNKKGFGTVGADMQVRSVGDSLSKLHISPVFTTESSIPVNHLYIYIIYINIDNIERTGTGRRQLSSREEQNSATHVLQYYRAMHCGTSKWRSCSGKCRVM